MKESVYLGCACHNIEHMLVLEKWSEVEEVDISIQLNPLHGIFRRIFLALKYILGLKSLNSHWDVVILNKEEQQKIVNFLK